MAKLYGEAKGAGAEIGWDAFPGRGLANQLSK